MSTIDSRPGGIAIDHGRHFLNVEISIPEEVELVCRVGGNGSGKTSLRQWRRTEAPEHRVLLGIRAFVAGI